MLDAAAPARARAAARGGPPDRARRRARSTRPTRAACCWSRSYPRAPHDATAAETAPTEPLTAPGEVQVRRALLSVSDKTGIVDFARGLAELGVELVSTGGTAGALADAGIPHRSISDYTGFPEIMDGRVKTLHPKLYAGLLAVRDDAEHLAAAADAEVELVDLVCVNLYPFEQTVAKRGVADARGDREHRHRRPDDDPRRREELRLRRAGRLARQLRRGPRRAARRRRRRSCRSPRASRSRPRRSPTPPATTPRSRAGSPSGATTSRRCSCARSRRSPTSPTARTRTSAPPTTRRSARRRTCSSNVRQLGGKQLSFNNLLDLNAARAARARVRRPGVRDRQAQQPLRRARSATTPLDAYRKAFACDPQSAFGGVIALNRPVDGALAEALVQQFVEVLFAPGYDDAALETLASRPNLRILQDDEQQALHLAEPDLKQVVGGLLVQDRDLDTQERAEMTVATRREPTDAEWSELLFAWRVCKHVRSNAIVLAQRRRVGRHRRRADEPRRLGADRAREGARGAAARCRAPCWPPTRSSRSPTGRSRDRRGRRRRSSSRAARCATPR